MNSQHTNTYTKQSFNNVPTTSSPPNRNSNIDYVDVHIAKPAEEILKSHDWSSEEPKLSAIAQMMKDQDDL